jgi:UDP-N-acetylglucosamine--N-acetylmuramyl-(pentapeptide) pyrophosphoryl-undecaprenol N-acetylglucosamine transferase
VFNLVVFGGSQGAQFFSSAIPSAICLLDDDLRKRIHVVQQARPEDKDKVASCYSKLGMPAESRRSFPTCPPRSPMPTW